MNLEKKNVAIIFGGCSTEYDVSLQSAYAVITNIDKKAYTPVLIGIHKTSGKWFLYKGDSDRIPDDNWYNKEDCVPVIVSPDRELHGIVWQENNTLQTLSLDAAFPVLHGKNGEDGTVQGLLELANIALIGCDTLCSALCMDKDLAHQVAASAGIRVPLSFSIQRPYVKKEVLAYAKQLSYPLFIKPMKSGSSLGISKVTEKSSLISAIDAAFSHDETVIMEQAIEGFEVGCAVLGTTNLTIGEVDEIELSQGFFDYTEKYSLKSSQIHVPARITDEQAEEIKQCALTIYRALKCRHFARVDMFLTPEGEIVFNEVNTIPGFTAHSRYPNMLKAGGLSFDCIVNRLIQMGISDSSIREWRKKNER